MESCLRPSRSSAPTVSWSGKFPAPIDLWDTDWPSSGYYWTVIPVAFASPGALFTNVASPGANAAATTLPLSNTSGITGGDTLLIGTGLTQETATVISVSTDTVTFASATKFGHGAGEPVVRTGGSFEYRDMELAQDVCASGRVARFGKTSEPALTSSGELFASGLSPSGRLTSAAHTAAFYGSPLVSWTPALGAAEYEVQWGKTRYPFVAEKDPRTGSPGFLTTGTSAVLPLTPGTWYYRVRGFAFSLPTGSQQMSWSDPARIVVTKPTFKIVKP